MAPTTKFTRGYFLHHDDLNLISKRLDKLEALTGAGQVEILKSGGKTIVGLSRNIPDIAHVEMFEDMPAYGCGRAGRLIFNPQYPDDPGLFGYDKDFNDTRLTDVFDGQAGEAVLNTDESKFTRGHKDSFEIQVYDVHGCPAWMYDRRIAIRYPYAHDDRFLLLPTFVPDWCYLTQTGDLSINSATAQKADFQIAASSNKRLFEIHNINGINTLKINRAINCIFFLTINASRTLDTVNSGLLNYTVKSDWEHTNDFGSGSDSFASGQLLFQGSGTPPNNCDGINSAAATATTVFGLLQNRLDKQHLFVELQRASGSSTYSVENMQLYVKQLFCPHYPIAKPATNLLFKDEGGYKDENEFFEGNYNADFNPNTPNENIPEHNAGYPEDEPAVEIPTVANSGRTQYLDRGT